MTYNLCIRETYKGKDETDKTVWNRIGVMFESNGKQYIKLYHMPGTLISVFEPKPKEEQGEAF